MQTVISPRGIALLTAIFAFTSAIAAVATNTWTGAAGDDAWATKGNWSLGSVPGNGTVVVFDTAGSVTATNHAHMQMSTLIVRQGNVTLKVTNGNSNLEIYGSNNTSELWVAEGATVDFQAVTFKPGGGSISSTVFVKRGLGTCKSPMSILKELDVVEGTYIARDRWYCSYVRVASGAELQEEDVGALNNGYPTVDLEKGAVLRLAANTSSSESRIGGLTGEGTVICEHGRSTMNLARGPHLFSGTISSCLKLDKRLNVTDEEARFILGARDVYANCSVDKGSGLSLTSDGDTLRFAPGIGVFRFKKLNFGSSATYALPTEDTDGLPVTLELNCNSGQEKLKPVGTGTLQFGDSMTFTSANELSNFEGAIAITNGTLTLDATVTAADLANLKSVTAKAGTSLSISGAEALEFACPVRGAAWLSPNVNTRFDDFCFRGGSISPASAAVATFAGGLASFDSLKFAKNDTRSIAMAGGVLAGPFAVDANLATVVPTVLARPCAPIPSYENAECGNIELRGGEIHLTQQTTSKSVIFSALDGGTAFIYGKFEKMPSVAFNGATIAMCPPDTADFKPFGSAVTVGAGGATFVSGVSGGGAARNYCIVGADPDGAGDGGVTRYGAGSFRTQNAMSITGPFRVLDGVLVVNNSSEMSQAGAEIYGTGSFELGNMKFEPANGLSKALSFGATTVSGGAYLSLAAGVVPTFASVGFANGGALFLEEGRTVNFTAAPENAPIFTYSAGTLATTAYCDAARHLVLSGGALAAAQDFGAARGVLAVGADASVSASLAGTAGVGFVGPADGTKRRLTLASASTFTGGAFVNALEVVPSVAGALGAGAVTVGAGEWMGGRVRFTTPVTLANDFTVAGWGPVDEQGALVFDASATIGALAVGPYAARVRVNAGATATVSGKLSGGDLQIAGLGGVFEIAGENVLTGRLDVIRATLSVAGAAASLGAGDVWLDDATLALANTSTLTVTNRIYGLGKIVCGGADVNFDSPDLEFSGTLRVAPGATVTINRHALLDESLKIHLPAGATLDFDGATRTVDRISGGGTVRNGNITCTRPWQRRGCALILR